MRVNNVPALKHDVQHPFSRSNGNINRPISSAPTDEKQDGRLKYKSQTPITDTHVGDRKRPVPETTKKLIRSLGVHLAAQVREAVRRTQSADYKVICFNDCSATDLQEESWSENFVKQNTKQFSFLFLQIWIAEGF